MPGGGEGHTNKIFTDSKERKDLTKKFNRKLHCENGEIL